MRTIKFRGKRVDNGEWVYGDLIHGQGSKHGEMYILPQTHIYPKGCNELDGWNVLSETVGQFTGLLDMNGREIYEGNIDVDGLGRNHTVEYYSGGFWLNSTHGGYTERLHSDRQTKIIGNIHDNPELLD